MKYISDILTMEALHAFASSQEAPVGTSVLSEGDLSDLKYPLLAKRKKRGAYRKQDIAERFWSKVKRTKDCWLWQASFDRKGYGQFGVGDVENGVRKERAHRMAWILTRGKIPSGFSLLHQCDTPACVNPKHLRLGTQQENQAEMKERNRSARGTRNGQSKLTEAQVKAIRKSKDSYSALARRFNVHWQTVARAARRETWSCV